MNPGDRIRYDRGRNFGNKSFKSACYAPFVSLFFDPQGLVRACCQSLIHSLGNIRNQRLDDIWNGEAINKLRRSLAAYDLPLSGCNTCRWEVERGNHLGAFARIYDHHAIDTMYPIWPRAMDFLLSNNCNLQCVQCVGEFSSSIRRYREQLPPLEAAYNDDFFQDLRRFLPHLEHATFLGGEAFVCRENYRIWDMMIEDGLRVHCTIVTNGTAFGGGVERILERLPCSISVSLDGATRETVESIRRGAKFEKVMANVQRFLDYTKAQGTSFGLSYCLMPQNQHEFADFLLLAEDLGCGASVNTVYQPTQYSLHALQESELRSIVDEWSRRDAEMCRRLNRLKHVWDRQLHDLRNLLDAPSPFPERYYFAPVSPQSWGGSPRGADTLVDAGEPGRELPGTDGDVREQPPSPSMVISELSEWSDRGQTGVVFVDRDGVVSYSSPEGFAGLDADYVQGRSMTDVLFRLRELHGYDAEILSEEADSCRINRTIEFKDASGSRTTLRWVAVARGNDGRVEHTTEVYAAVRK